MCGAAHGPDHDDPAAAAVCDAYHGFTRAELPRLERELGDRERELLWTTALGLGPEALARRLASPVGTVRAELTELAARLADVAGRR